MAKVTPISEHFQHFLAEMKETFWGRSVWPDQAGVAAVFRTAVGAAARPLFLVPSATHGGRGRRRVYRNGYYERDFVTRFGTIRLRIARTREKSFLPCGLERFQRRAEEVSMLIREAFLRGISTRQVGRVVATLTGEVVSAQTGSKLTPRSGRGGTPVPSGEVERRLRLPVSGWRELAGAASGGGRKRVQMLVAYGVRRDGTRHLLAFLRSPGESQADWEGLLQDLYRRGLEGKHLALIVTDGCPRIGGGPSPRCIRERGISAAGCTRCAIFWRKCASQTMRK
jgi:hypothetical protein